MLTHLNRPHLAMETLHLGDMVNVEFHQPPISSTEFVPFHISQNAQS
ncbi:hypothetical protein SAMN05216167_11253 [Spirosoma endophyticum]|uniref:Uncharacterized protein n=1 Tax=Spirosoma endophyticum TaxID=662367 RepID=A0A1I1Z960_9BACT|nr:hypothetical protein SAMN05216167_11253 [Spirosoma endophyticum]